MIYSVVWKKYSELQKGFALVEDRIEAEGISVVDGALLFFNRDATFMAIPAGSWAGVEPATEPISTLITN